MNSFTLTIVDDPANTTVYKGPGFAAAVRAEKVIRCLRQEFPGFQFDTTRDDALTWLAASVEVVGPVAFGQFLVFLRASLLRSGTRLRPDQETVAHQCRVVDTEAYRVA
ncbi:hypothetical protein [Tahibacter amnicola]|uniref:Uncharacterized protein n=1 Tax=Tahibacter amnicola TaxID=2976241 RepID=A0ABY6BJR4_9GAMM|nr:hypothetical protein [Tahibacter amnicola]UXI70253.1 hypothetical protein N4264_11640 [Tahibacter amnicola]